jgi:hypothetical protein
MTAGMAGSVFALGMVGLLPVLAWSALLVLVAMLRDLSALIAHSAKSLFHRSHIDV